MEINILATHVTTDNWLGLPIMLGTALSLFTTVDIYRYGDGDNDDDSLVGCMELMTDRRDKFEIINFAQVEESNKIQQGTVEGHYKMAMEDE